MLRCLAQQKRVRLKAIFPVNQTYSVACANGKAEETRSAVHIYHVWKVG